MKKATWIVFAIVAVLFLVAWLTKAVSASNEANHALRDSFLLTLAAFLTLAILSFLYRDNPYYKFAEHLFVGVSAAYWMCLSFWSTIVGNLIPRLSAGMAAWFEVPPIEPEFRFGYISANMMYWVPVVLGLMLMMRLTRQHGWMARWPLAFIVGTTAGLNFIRYLRSDFINQISSTFLPLLVDWRGLGAFWSSLDLAASGQLVLMLGNWVVFLGVFCGLVYFFFSKEHTGWFGRASRVGIWVLMITFGASFGYTVMGRISLLVGRMTFLFHDWLGLIN